tara:strand:+ start:844 stop:1359 length:516 start_codon:yes stop_codon:yes gene_type:complete
MKNTEQVVKNILQTTNKSNQITYDIVEGIDGRLSQKGTITPKQGVWLLNKIFREDMHIPADFMSKVENGGIPEQQEAYSKIRTAIQDGVMPKDDNSVATTDGKTAPAVEKPLVILEKLKERQAEKNALNNSTPKVSGISIAARNGIVETALRILIEDGVDLPKHLIDEYLK